MNDYNELPMAQCEPKALVEPETVTDRLMRQRRMLESRLKETDQALEALGANPEISKVLTLLGKALGRI